MKKEIKLSDAIGKTIEGFDSSFTCGQAVSLIVGDDTVHDQHCEECEEFKYDVELCCNPYIAAKHLNDVYQNLCSGCYRKLKEKS